ncbi:hypothetical protein DKX38_021714 [Salix brachista]|uniref:Complex 1 LYR protein domain-containing protein n=1 Tax=Salix brachista TaxID=2182728 RepID=A0A5N5KDM9_9ROSI|nr:hypothetical protein DKX38_021714 [Salix brachista]
MVLSFGLQDFILRARVLKLYRQALRTTRRAPDDARADLKQTIRQEMENNRDCNDKQRIRFLISEGLERLKRLDEMLDMQGHSHKTLTACLDTFTFCSGDCCKNAVPGFWVSLPPPFSVLKMYVSAWTANLAVSWISMRKLCPNYDREDALDTVLEVPIPEEMFTKMGNNSASRWQNMRALMSAQAAADKSTPLQSKSNNEFIALLKLVGSPLIPFQARPDQPLTRPLKDCSIVLRSPVGYGAKDISLLRISRLMWKRKKHISFHEQEASTAKYIVQQYIAAIGGALALNSVKSMCAVGQVKMAASEMHQGEDSAHAEGKSEVGGFVLWQKNPDLWYLELVVSGYKVSAGSDGKVAWNQSSSQASHANRGPPRPLRRFFQGLDPRCTANLFLEAGCITEKKVNDEDCFVLKLETDSNTLKAQSSSNTEIVHHIVWGYFSQRTGLLVKFEDTKLVKMKPIKGNDNVFWETSIESVVGDYRYIEGINVAHSGKTTATLHRYGASHNHKRKIEETWMIDEVDFNICGLSMDCFLPPADLKREQGGEQ